jgi:hypothetical protein
MSTALDFKSMPGITKQMREELVATFDAMSNWRDEIETVNKRCMGKVLDQTSAVARSMGWSDQTIRTTREYLEKTSKMQIEMISLSPDGAAALKTSAGVPHWQPKWLPVRQQRTTRLNGQSLPRAVRIGWAGPDLRTERTGGMSCRGSSMQLPNGPRVGPRVRIPDLFPYRHPFACRD